MSNANDHTQSDAAPADAVDPTAGKTVAEIFGEIVWLMTQDPACRDLKIGDLERLVMPPILLKQFHITYAPVPVGMNTKGESVRPVLDSKTVAELTKTALQPVRVELFAMVSKALATQIDTQSAGNPTHSLEDWNSGAERRTIVTASVPGLA